MERGPEVDSEAPRRAGRPARISRAAIVEAVLELGLDRATTSAVAARLGVDQSTLYGHVTNRDDMLDAAADAAIDRSAWPATGGGDWRAYLLACADALWEMFHRTPGLAMHLRGMTTVPAALTRRAIATIKHLTELGWDLPLAALVVDTVGDMVADSYLTTEALDSPLGRVADAVTGREHIDRALRDAELDTGELGAQYAAIIRAAMGAPGQPSTWWHDKIELVLDGVQHRLGGP